MDHKRRHRHSLSREAAPLDGCATPISHFSYLQLAAPAANAAVAQRSQLIDSHEHQHSSFPQRGMSYSAGAVGIAQYESGLTNGVHARPYHGKPLGGGGAQHFHELKPQSRSETYPQGHRLLGPPVQQQQFQHIGARQSFSPVDQLSYDTWPTSISDLASTSSNESLKTQQHFSAPASPRDRPAHATRPRLSSCPSRGAAVAAVARKRPSDCWQQQHQFASTISANDLSHPHTQHPQPQLHVICNPFAASHQQTFPTGFTPMERRRSASAPPMGIPLPPPGTSADLIGSSLQNSINPDLYGLAQSISTPSRRSAVGYQPSWRKLNSQLPRLTGLPSTSGCTFSAGPVTSDSLPQTSMQMHPRVQHLLLYEQPARCDIRIDRDALHHEYSASPPPRPASAPIMPPTPTTIGFPQIYRESEICQSQQQHLAQEQVLLPEEPPEHKPQQNQRPQQNLSSPLPQKHLPLAHPTFTRTPRVHRCPKPFCTKTYKNPNGLKYHLDRGICEHFMSLDCPAIAASADSTRPFDTLEAAAAAGTVKIAHRPYWCKVPGCSKKYKNLNGLKYHAKAMHPALDFRAEVKGVHAQA
ncbi:hypothetical protein BDZ88DRAFT_454917 [Geranomyces variabilis]|nr:hypothetical protein BDZ88DRAFT_454917 [Geranomyces variabilis]KAJ3132326.1 hypothetical protein HDU90_007387 [Geranomyces variabilis]